MGDLSGTVTLSGSPVQGATVWVIDTTTDTVVATDTSDVNGDWSVSVAGGNERYHALVQYESGGTKYNAESLPFLSTPATLSPVATDVQFQSPTASVTNVSDIPDSVIHRYDFEDDSDTTTLTDTAGSADGSITGMSYTTNQAEDNFAGGFDGNDDFVDIPTAEGFPLSITAYIFPRVVKSNQAWINWGFDFGANEGVVIKAPGSDGNFTGFTVFVGDTNNNFGTDDLTNQKAHIGVTIDASANVTAYLDGSEIGSANVSASGGSGQSYLGAEGPSKNNGDVILDNVEIHDKELTQSEVQNRM
ncbi:hypothetical protein OSG_eHP27_00070 [environmental Halophage eHP-27]|nr:hypothetical protein OSG_eHP27_00070 [environmental Halophage eHP-27]